MLIEVTQDVRAIFKVNSTFHFNIINDSHIITNRQLYIVVIEVK